MQCTEFNCTMKFDIKYFFVELMNKSSKLHGFCHDKVFPKRAWSISLLLQNQHYQKNHRYISIVKYFVYESIFASMSFSKDAESHVMLKKRSTDNIIKRSSLLMDFWPAGSLGGICIRNLVVLPRKAAEKFS